MDNIGFLVWSSDLALGEDGNALIARFLENTGLTLDEYQTSVKRVYITNNFPAKKP